MTQGQHYAPSNYTEKRKGKSRKRGLIIGLIVVIVLAIIAGFFAYQNFFGDKTGEVKQGEEITVVIPAGSSTDKIASILVDDGVIGSANAFTNRVKQLNQAASLQSGSYVVIGGVTLTTHQDACQWPDGQAACHPRGLQSCARLPIRSNRPAE